MRTKVAAALGLLLMGSALMSAHAQVATAKTQLRSPVAAEAATAVDAFHAALSGGDVKGALALMADDVLIFEGGGVERSKSEYGSHHAPADAAFAAAVPSQLMSRTAEAEGAIAWVASELHAKGQYKDKAVDLMTTETMILKKTADGWRIVHVQWSSRPVKK